MCETVYSPVLDIQRYCMACHKWFHVSCLGEPVRTNRMCGPLALQLSNAPIARGWMKTPPSDWMIVGSGRIVRKVLAMSQVKGSHDWEQIVGSSFLSYLKDSPPEFFACPTCSNEI
jgi:hypothetical protein